MNCFLLLQACSISTVLLLPVIQSCGSQCFLEYVVSIENAVLLKCFVIGIFSRFPSLNLLMLLCLGHSCPTIWCHYQQIFLFYQFSVSFWTLFLCFLNQIFVIFECYPFPDFEWMLCLFCQYRNILQSFIFIGIFLIFNDFCMPSKRFRNIAFVDPHMWIFLIKITLVLLEHVVLALFRAIVFKFDNEIIIEFLKKLFRLYLVLLLFVSGWTRRRCDKLLHLFLDRKGLRLIGSRRIFVWNVFLEGITFLHEEECTLLVSSKAKQMEGVCCELE